MKSFLISFENNLKHSKYKFWYEILSMFLGHSANLVDLMEDNQEVIFKAIRKSLKDQFKELSLEQILVAYPELYLRFNAKKLAIKVKALSKIEDVELAAAHDEAEPNSLILKTKYLLDESVFMTAQ
jgi:hypothetical protein